MPEGEGSKAMTKVAALCVLAASVIVTPVARPAEGGYCVVVTEAHFANQQALIHRLETYFPGLGADTDVPNPGKCDPQRLYQIVFRASRASG